MCPFDPSPFPVCSDERPIMTSGVFEDREGWRLIYRNQLIRVKTSRKISAIATVNSQVSQPHADLIGSMDSVDGVFSTFGMSQVS